MRRNYLLAFSAMLMWSTMSGAVKLLFNRTPSIPNFQVLSVSAFFAFVALLLYIVVTGKIKAIKQYDFRDILNMSGLGFLGFFMYTSLYFYGISVLTAQEACIVNHLWPMMIVVFSVIILGEKLSAVKIGALASSFIGVVILSGGIHGDGQIWGILSCAAGAVCYGLFTALNKKKDYDQNIAMTIMWLVTALAAAVAGLFTETWVPLSTTEIIGLLWIGAATDAAAYLLWTIAIHSSENTAPIANMAYITPFMAMIVSWLLLGEKLSPTAAIALIFIVGGVAVQGLYEAKHNKA